MRSIVTAGAALLALIASASAADEVLAHVEQAALELALGDRDDGPLSYRPMMHLQARTELPWHQDNGCLWVIPGSHLAGTKHHFNGGSGPFRVGYAGPAEDGVAVPVPKGGVLVFSSLLMHRSGPNTRDRSRRAWIIQFCPAEARSALSGRLLDDRLLVAQDLAVVLGSYDQR